MAEEIWKMWFDEADALEIAVAEAWTAWCRIFGRRGGTEPAPGLLELFQLFEQELRRGWFEYRIESEDGPDAAVWSADRPASTAGAVR